MSSLFTKRGNGNAKRTKKTKQNKTKTRNWVSVIKILHFERTIRCYIAIWNKEISVASNDAASSRRFVIRINALLAEASVLVFITERIRCLAVPVCVVGEE